MGVSQQGVFESEFQPQWGSLGMFGVGVFGVGFWLGRQDRRCLLFDPIGRAMAIEHHAWLVAVLIVGEYRVESRAPLLDGILVGARIEVERMASARQGYVKQA